MLAIEGPDPAFRCEGILENVPGARDRRELRPDLPHLPGDAPGRTGLAQALARQTIAGIADSMERRFPQDKAEGRALPASEELSRPGCAGKAYRLRAWR